MLMALYCMVPLLASTLKTFFPSLHKESEINVNILSGVQRKRDQNWNETKRVIKNPLEKQNGRPMNRMTRWEICINLSRTTIEIPFEVLIRSTSSCFKRWCATYFVEWYVIARCDCHEWSKSFIQWTLISLSNEYLC